MAAAPKRTQRAPKKRARATRQRDWGPKFLKAFRATGMVKAACEQVEIGRRTAYQRRERDDEFAAAWAEVEDDVTEELEQEAKRRAAQGTLKPVFQGGEQVGEIREFSDTLLIFLLKARKPATYRDNVRVQHTGPGDGPVEHTVAVDPESRKLIDALLARRADARP